MLISNYRYVLDTSSKKYKCPNCAKNTLVRFIDSASGNLMPIDFGRCDREEKCSYFKAPSQNKRVFFVSCLSIVNYSAKSVKITDSIGFIHYIPVKAIYESIHSGLWLYEWFLCDSGIYYSENDYKLLDSYYKPYITTNQNIEKEPSYIPLDVLEKMYLSDDIEDNLIKFLDSKFPFQKVEKAKRDYFITGTNLKWNSTTIFWQIDNNEKIRTAKLMLYNESNGKRVKEPYVHQNWLHKVLKLENYNLEQCLFGLHLVSDNYDKNIAIVESEKTAIIMSIMADDFIWLSTGGKNMLKKKLLEPIKNRTIILYPDKSVYDNWKKKADDFNSDGYRIAVSKIIEESNLPDGSDIADMI